MGTRTFSKLQKIGNHRGKGRIWLQGRTLLETGWVRGTKFSAEFKDGYIILRRNPEGERTVSGKVTAAGTEVPIIDINSRDVLESLSPDTYRAAVSLTRSTIYIEHPDFEADE